ncbi:MAG: LysR family transcriptional regulator [Parasphingorhabdus sp.]
MTYSLDWTNLQAFIAVAEHGSLSAAVRAVGGSQPTMSRHISALENELGVVLFERTSNGLMLTPTGTLLREHANNMSEAAGKLLLAADGSSETIEGTVRITASESVATYSLPPIITALRVAEPEIDIEMVASDQTENLLLREADIAIRMYRPTQADVFTKKIGEIESGMFASHEYLAKRGIPETEADLFEHDFIGTDRDDAIIKGFRAHGLKIGRNDFPFRCDSQIVNWQLVLAGYGIGFTQLQVGESDPRVRRLFADRTMTKLPIWLTAHSELKTSLRVRRVFDFLAESFGASWKHQDI